MRKFILIFLFSVTFFLIPSMQFQTAFAAIQVTLTISDPNISFSDADPDLLSSIVATPNIVGITIKVTGNPGNPWRLTHLASGDLSPSIPISNISWTVSPQPPFINGSMSRLAPQIAAQGVGNVNQTGNFTFSLINLWSYNTGSFSRVTTFTLSAP